MGVVSMASTSVSKTESEGSNPSTCANPCASANHTKVYPHVWFDADKNVVIKNDNFSWWTEENVNLWCEVYNSYYEYDNRVVKVLKFDGKELHTEPLEGFDLRDESKLNALDVPSLIQIHREYVDIWSKMLGFRHPLIPEGRFWFHRDLQLKNVMWCTDGRLRLIDPDHFNICQLQTDFSIQTKFREGLRPLEQLLTEKVR